MGLWFVLMCVYCVGLISTIVGDVNNANYNFDDDDSHYDYNYDDYYYNHDDAARFHKHTSPYTYIKHYFNYPVAVRGTANGLLFISDQNDGYVYVANLLTGDISILAGTGSNDYNGDDRDPLTTALSNPTGLCVSSDALTVLVADTSNNLVRRIDLAVVPTYAPTAYPSAPTVMPTTRAPVPPTATPTHRPTRTPVADPTHKPYKHAMVTVSGQYDSSDDKEDGAPALTAYLSHPQALFVDSAGNKYIADTQNCKIRFVDAETDKIYTLAGRDSGCGYSPDLDNDRNVNSRHEQDPHKRYKPRTSVYVDNPGGVWVDKHGNVYYSDTYNYIVRKISATETDEHGNNVITTVAGRAQSCCNQENNVLATNTELYNPEALWGDEDKELLYIAERYFYQVRVLNLKTGIIKAFAGQFHSQNCYDYGYSYAELDTFCGNNGPATSAYLTSPSALWGNSNGVVYIGDFYNYVVRQVDNGIITTFAGVMGQCCSNGDRGPATAMMLYYPTGVWGDSVGNVFISDYTRLYIVHMRNGIRDVVSGSHGTWSYDGDGHAALYSYYNELRGVSGDSNGNIFLVDSNNARIRAFNRYEPNRIVNTVVGEGDSSYSGDGGDARDAHLNSPQAIWVDSLGNVYLSDTYNNRVRHISATTGIISTIIGTDSYGNNGPGHYGTSTYLAYPRGLWGDADGKYLYVADSNNNRILRYSFETKRAHIQYYVDAENDDNYFYSGSGPSRRSRRQRKLSMEGGESDEGGEGSESNTYFNYNATDFNFNDTSNDFNYDEPYYIYNYQPYTDDGEIGYNPYYHYFYYTTAIEYDTEYGKNYYVGTPVGLWGDSVGNLYVSDISYHAIRMISLRTGEHSFYAGSRYGYGGYNGDQMPANAAYLYSPWSIWGNERGDLFIAEYDGSRVRVVDGETQQISTLLYSCGNNYGNYFYYDEVNDTPSHDFTYRDFYYYIDDDWTTSFYDFTYTAEFSYNFDTLDEAYNATVVQCAAYQTHHTFDARRNYATCSFQACGGEVLIVENCNGGKNSFSVACLIVFIVYRRVCG